MPTLGYNELNSLKSLFADAEKAVQQDEVLQEYLRTTENRRPSYTADERHKRMCFAFAYIIQLLNKVGEPYFENFKQKHPDVTHIRFIPHPYNPDKYWSIYMEFHMNFTWPVNYHKISVCDTLQSSFFNNAGRPYWKPCFLPSYDTISESLLDAVRYGDEDMYADDLYKFFDATKQWRNDDEDAGSLKQLLTAYDAIRKYDISTIKKFPKDIRPLLEGRYKSPTQATNNGAEPDVLQKALKAIKDSRVHYNAMQEILKTLEREVADWATEHANETGTKDADASDT